MAISTKGRYALRIMLDLAEHSGEVIKLKEIAGRQNISEKYMEQIISILNKAGYVRSTRGAQGGYQLVKNPAEYTVGMVLRLTEGSLAPVECLNENALKCEREDICATVEVYKRIYDAINGVIDNFTIADLLDVKNEKASNNYVI
ncbi:MAG: Rrf2 family transcriptional regulator [Lachnospiraceae bacterium]|nr:Rrf2 family transcriptional regulator [Lachnospiraceae bacterium]MBQ5849506.1 Rrf2 family transcriptional regulator [Lachnospiraceae bacterium]MEE0918446.1 Rrf2 family transcriptional regulator [Lachnospiraceae bacterium]